MVVSRGGFYSDDVPGAPMDHQTPYPRTALGFLGLTDVSVIEIEGQAISPEVAAKGLEAARSVATEMAGVRLAA